MYESNCSKTTLSNFLNVTPRNNCEKVTVFNFKINIACKKQYWCMKLLMSEIRGKVCRNYSRFVLKDLLHGAYKWHSLLLHCMRLTMKQMYLFNLQGHAGWV